MRRKAAPRAVLDRWSEVAAMRRTPAMRLAPSPLRRFFRGLPPEIGVRGHRRNHETKWSSEGKAASWGPTSVRNLGGPGTDPVHARQVDASKAPEGGPGRLLPTRLDRFLLGRIGVGGYRFRLPFG